MLNEDTLGNSPGARPCHSALTWTPSDSATAPAQASIPLGTCLNGRCRDLKRLSPVLWSGDPFYRTECSTKIRKVRCCAARYLVRRGFSNRGWLTAHLRVRGAALAALLVAEKRARLERLGPGAGVEAPPARACSASRR